MFCSEVSDGIVAQVGRSKDHVRGAAGTQRPLEPLEPCSSAGGSDVHAWRTHPFSPLLMTDGSVRISPTPKHTHTHTGPIRAAAWGGVGWGEGGHWSEGLLCAGALTLEVEHQQLPAGVLVGPVAEGQHGFLQEVGGVDLFSVVVVELPELAGDALFDSEPLSSRVAVEQKHLQKPADTEGPAPSLR